MTITIEGKTTDELRKALAALVVDFGALRFVSEDDFRDRHRIQEEYKTARDLARALQAKEKKNQSRDTE